MMSVVTGHPGSTTCRRQGGTMAPATRKPTQRRHAPHARNDQGDTPGTARHDVEGPRLPRVYVPRRRLWQQLDRAVRGSAVTMLVAPVGAGKTLGVGGWLR